LRIAAAVRDDVSLPSLRSPQCGAIARERDDIQSARWRFDVRIKYRQQQMVLVNESASNRKVVNRRVGISKRGRKSKSKRFFFHRGKSYSVLGPFTMEDGFLDISVVEGGYDGDTFFNALVRKVVSRRVVSHESLHCES